VGERRKEREKIGRRRGKGNGEGEGRDRGKENDHRPPSIFGLKVALRGFVRALAGQDVPGNGP